MIKQSVIGIFYEDPDIGIGGGNRYLGDIISWCLARGHRVILFTNAPAGFGKGRFDKNPRFQQEITVLFGPASLRIKGPTPKSVSKVWQYIIRIASPLILLINILKLVFVFKPAGLGWLISVNGGYPAAESAIAATVAGKISQIRSTLFVLSTPTERRWYLLPHELFIDFLVVNCCELVIVNSRLQKESLKKRRLGIEAKIGVVYNGVDLQHRNKIFRPAAVLNLTYVARIDKLKGHVYLVKAVKILKQKYDIRCNLIGEGGEIENVKKFVQDLGLENDVKIHGYISETRLQQVMAETDIYVHPSLWEGLPYSVIEAMASGVPVVATDVGAISEIVIPSKTGILIRPKNVDDIVGAVEFMVENPCSVNQMVNEAYNLYKRSLSIEIMHAMLDKVAKQISF